MLLRRLVYRLLRKLLRKRIVLLFMVLGFIIPLPLFIGHCTIVPTSGWCDGSLLTILPFEAFTKDLVLRTTDNTLMRWRNVGIGDRKVYIANCPALLSGDAKEQNRSLEIVKHYKKIDKPVGWYIHNAKNCTNFLSTRKYILDSITDEEKEFPIAYSILIFKDIEQVDRLLRAIYRPQNYYCIHVDSKSNYLYKTAISSIADCLPNVFIAPRYVNVRWGYFSVLEAELVCMEALWAAGKWKYFINLTGQEFPLKTNWDIVRILTAYNGSNNIEATMKRMTAQRYNFTEPLPNNMKLTKGSVHIVASRAFVDYVLHAEPAQALLEWCRGVLVSDEVFFSVLNHNPQLGVPGAYKGIPESDAINYPFLTRFKNWGDGPFNWTCGGQRVRQLCVFGVKDLPLIVSRPELFANKFYYDFQPQTLDCLEEWHYNRTRDEYAGVLTFNASYYASLDFVKNRVY